MYCLCIIFTGFYHSTVSCCVFILYQNTATFFGTNTLNVTINKENFTEFRSVNHVARPSRRQKSLWELFIWQLRVLLWWKESVLTRQNVVLSAAFFIFARYMRGLDKMSTVLSFMFWEIDLEFQEMCLTIGRKLWNVILLLQNGCSENMWLVTKCL